LFCLFIIHSFYTLCPLFGDSDDHYILSFDILLSGRYFMTFQGKLCYPSSKQTNDNSSSTFSESSYLTGNMACNDIWLNCLVIHYVIPYSFTYEIITWYLHIVDLLI